jgi:Rho termination factor, N-terminal domain.
MYIYKMPLKSELYAKAKQIGVKGISRMTKKQLEEALIIYTANDWFNNLIDASFVINPLDLSGNIYINNINE